MKEFQKWWADSKVASYLRALFVAIATSAIIDFAKTGRFDFTNWEAWVIGALVALLPVASRKYNPQDSLS